MYKEYHGSDKHKIHDSGYLRKRQHERWKKGTQEHLVEWEDSIS